jgi:hypothetical protein
MNRCTYVLAGNASSRMSVPIVSPPQNLQGAMKDLFTEQEKERYRLRMQVTLSDIVIKSCFPQWCLIGYMLPMNMFEN